MMSLGEKLREARQRKGLSIEEVAQGTKMVSQMVREIEENDFHRFPAPLYGRGFIRIFAEFVGIDPAPLVNEYSKAQIVDNDLPMVPLEIIDEGSGALSIVSPAGIPQSSPKKASAAGRSVRTDAGGQTDSLKEASQLPEVSAEPAVSSKPAPFAKTGNFVIAAMPSKPAGAPGPRLTSEEEKRRAAAEAEDIARAAEKPRVFDFKPESVTEKKPPRPVGTAVKPFVYPNFEPVMDKTSAEPIGKDGPEKTIENIADKRPVSGLTKKVSAAIKNFVGTLKRQAWKKDDDAMERPVVQKYRLAGTVAAIAIVFLIIVCLVFESGKETSATGTEPDRTAGNVTETAGLPGSSSIGTVSASSEASIVRVLPPPPGFAD